MSELGEVPESTEDSAPAEFQQQPEIPDSKKELIGKALGEVEGVLSGNDNIRWENKVFFENVYYPYDHLARITGNVDPRQEGSGQVRDSFGMNGRPIGSALRRLEEVADRAYLPYGIREEIQSLLVKAVLAEQKEQAEQQAEEASFLFKGLTGKVEDSVKGLRQERGGVVRTSENNLEEANQLGRRYRSEATAAYVQASRRLNRVFVENNLRPKRIEDEQVEENRNRQSRFNQYVEKIVSPTVPEEEK